MTEEGEGGKVFSLHDNVLVFVEEFPVQFVRTYANSTFGNSLAKMLFPPVIFEYDFLNCSVIVDDLIVISTF